MTREQALEQSVKELGKWLSDLTVGGRGNPQIASALARGRTALKMEKQNA